MKFASTKVLFAVLALARATVADPCKDDGECIGEMKACTENPTGCCEGFECHGYNFFKRCQAPPSCLGQWYSCNPDPGENEEAKECCDGFTCVATENGYAECQKPTKRQVEIPGFKIVEDPPPPPTIPEETFTCPTPTVKKARLTGDPHIRTFDGLTYDCQGVGEHIVFKSTKTSRVVQNRFTRVGNRDVSVTHGVAMRDQGGATIPVVQVSIPVTDDAESTIVGTKGCKLQLFVNEEQVSLVPGVSYTSDAVTVKLEGTAVTTTYPSGFSVRVTMGFWNGCLLNTYLDVPVCEEDEVTGLLGDADANPNNDWINKDGSLATIPEGSWDRRKKPAYDFCVPNWCLTQEEDSIFHYNEVGKDFGYYRRCGLEYGESLVEFVADLPVDIVNRCQGDMGCMIDALDDDEEELTATIRQAIVDNFVQEQCSPAKGDCSAGMKCCDGLSCLPFSPTDWKCSEIPTLTQLQPKCNPFEGGYCDKVTCCGERECVEKKAGLWQCQKPAECVAEFNRCNSDDDCCDKTMQCVHPRKGKNAKRKTCRKLPTPCSAVNQMCFAGQNCCPGFECKKGACRKIKPKKWGQTCATVENPAEKPCDDDLACMPFKNRSVCQDPGIKKTPEGKLVLKKGSYCKTNDDELPCGEGLVCEKLTKKEKKRLRKNNPDAYATKLPNIGQCEEKGGKEARDKYREEKGVTVEEEPADEPEPEITVEQTVAVEEAECTPNYYRIKSASSMAWETSPGYGARDCIVQNAEEGKMQVLEGAVKANGNTFGVSLTGTLKFQTAKVAKENCWIEQAGHKAGQGCFFAGKEYDVDFEAGKKETVFDVSKCERQQEISHVEIVIGCCE